MHVPRVIGIVASSVTRGRCRYCQQPIVWAITESKPGRPARTLPFDAPRPWPLSETRNDETGVVFEYWPTMALHLRTCPHQPIRRKSKTMKARRTNV